MFAERNLQIGAPFGRCDLFSVGIWLSLGELKVTCPCEQLTIIQLNLDLLQVTGGKSRDYIENGCSALTSALSAVLSTSNPMAAYFFASPVDVDVKLEGEELRKQVEVKQEKERIVSCPVYYDGDSVGGTVSNASSISLAFDVELTAQIY